MPKFSLPVAAMAGGALLALAACSGRDDEMVASNEESEAAAANAGVDVPIAADSHAALFLKDVIEGANGEIMLGQLANSRGSTAGVRDLGRMIADDHSLAKNQAAQVANVLGVVVPTGTKPEADAEYEKLLGLEGNAFDSEFIAYIVQAHEKGIAKYETEAASGDPRQVTDFASQSLPTLKKHHAAAQALE